MNKVITYLAIYRTDLAEKEVNEMKAIDDEHICTLLSNIYLQVIIQL